MVSGAAGSLVRFGAVPDIQFTTVLSTMLIQLVALRTMTASGHLDVVSDVGKRSISAGTSLLVMEQ